MRLRCDSIRIIDVIKSDIEQYINIKPDIMYEQEKV